MIARSWTVRGGQSNNKFGERSMNRLHLPYWTAAALGLLTVGWTAEPGPLPPAADQSLARAIFAELIEINTTHARGSTEAAQAIERRLLASDFPAADVVL